MLQGLQGKSRTVRMTPHCFTVGRMDTGDRRHRGWWRPIQGRGQVPARVSGELDVYVVRRDGSELELQARKLIGAFQGPAR